MQPVETSISGSVREHHSIEAGLNAVRTALERPQIFPTTSKRECNQDKPGEMAVAMRLAGEAIATAARAAESELRKVRELLNETETRARAAEERAQAAEKQMAEWEQLLGDIRDQILGKVPKQRTV
jgi:hypothetical protein